MAPRNLLILATALLTLAGCDNEPHPRTETATPSTTTSSDPSKTSNASPTDNPADPEFADLLPPRRRELDLTGVDPCTDLLTDQQLRDLNYDLGYNRPPTPLRDDIHGGPACVFASNGGSGGVNRNVSTLITIPTTEGALTWVTDPAREPDRRPDVATIEGFSALVLPHPRCATTASSSSTPPKASI